MNTKINFFLIILNLLIIDTDSIAQSGYLGSTLNVNAQINSRTFIAEGLDKVIHESKLIDNTKYYKKTNLIKLSTLLSVNKVLNDKFQLGINFRYTKFETYANEYVDTIQSISGGVNTVDYTLFNSLESSFKALSLNFKYYYSGISPIGKYHGFEFGFGKAKIKKNQKHYYGNSSNIGSQGQSLFIFKKTYGIGNLHESDVIGNPVVNSLFLNYSIGQTIPLTSKLGLNLEMSVPIMRLYLYNGKKTLGFWTRTPNTIHEQYSGSTYQAIASGLRTNQGVRLNIGLKYFI